MAKHPITKISQITDKIFLSGIFPLCKNISELSRLNIKFLISCVSNDTVLQCQDNIINQVDGIIILTLPYNDNILQNLWQKNDDKIDVRKYAKNMDDLILVDGLTKLYKNKPLIDIGYHFMKLAIKSGQNVLIHCMAGISRSVSIISYYFMKEYHMSFADSLQHIRSNRSIVGPNMSFRTQLSKYQDIRDKYTSDNSAHIIEFFENKSRDKPWRIGWQK